MNRLILLILGITLLHLPVKATDTIRKQTYIYSQKEGIDLKLDKYVMDDTIKHKPCIIFVFGGGFYEGQRDREDYLAYFNSLAENGNVVVSIDYRLGMKDFNIEKLKGNSQKGLEEKIAAHLIYTVDMAVSDLMDATRFVLNNSLEWNIDENKIIVSGSSAGAITALSGEYAVSNKYEIAQKLPDSFKYAGVISFAGAIFSHQQRDLKWNNKTVPHLLFHGSADKNVPYDIAALGDIVFYGSKHIASELDKLSVPYYFYDEIYATHTIATTPMTEQLDIINGFIENEIKKQKRQQIHSTVKLADRNPVETDFSIYDYFRYNIQPE